MEPKDGAKDKPLKSRAQNPKNPERILESPSICDEQEHLQSSDPFSPLSKTLQSKGTFRTLDRSKEEKNGAQTRFISYRHWRSLWNR